MQALIVNDSFMRRTVLSNILAELGFETTVAKSGAEAVEHLNDGLQPDLMLADFYMPNMSGLELLDKVREMRRQLANMRIVIVIPDGDSVMKQWAMHYGADECLSRPFNTETMLKLLQSLGLNEAHLSLVSELSAC